MFTIQEVVKHCEGRLFGRAMDQPLLHVSTDTRVILPDSLFFALRGDRFDGHLFVREAFQKGALAAVVDKEGYSKINLSHLVEKDAPLVMVKNVYEALGKLASAYRNRFHIPIIAVTGSAGKTTTKEYMGALLGERLKVRISKGNLNNHIGLPLNLFQLTKEDQIGVFEIGASAAGEIDYLCSILKPTLGVITCVLPAHLKSFGSLDRVYRTKLELAEWLAKNRGTLFVNGDNFELVARAKQFRVKLITFGKSQGCDFVVSDEKQAGEFLRFQVNHKYEFNVHGFGIFNVMNALAALTVLDHLMFDLNEAAAHWKQFVSVPNRFEVERLEAPDVQIIKDCYNANPESFSLALQSFAHFSASGKKIIVAGDMKELGKESEDYHEKLGSEIAETSADLLIAVGEFAQTVIRAAQEKNYTLATVAFQNTSDVPEFLASVLCDGDLVLLKGSRAMKLEQIVDTLKRERHTQSVL